MTILSHGSNKDCPAVQAGTHTHCPTHEIEEVTLYSHGQINRIEAYRRLVVWIEREQVKGPIALLVKLLQRDEGLEIKL